MNGSQSVSATRCPDRQGAQKSIEPFVIELRVPRGVETEAEFRASFLGQEGVLHQSLEAVERYVERELSSREIHRSNPTAQRSIMLAAKSAVDELLGNLLYYGVLGLDGPTRDAFNTSSSSKHVDAVHSLESALVSPEVSSRVGRFSISLSEQSLVVRYSDPQGFPGFEKMMEKINSEGFDYSETETHGRGFLVLQLYFEPPRRDPETKEIVFVRSVQDIAAANDKNTH